jgi:hypothetical protein
MGTGDALCHAPELTKRDQRGDRPINDVISQAQPVEQIMHSHNASIPQVQEQT